MYLLGRLSVQISDGTHVWVKACVYEWVCASVSVQWKGKKSWGSNGSCATAQHLVTRVTVEFAYDQQPLWVWHVVYMKIVSWIQTAHVFKSWYSNFHEAVWLCKIRRRWLFLKYKYSIYVQLYIIHAIYIICLFRIAELVSKSVEETVVVCSYHSFVYMSSQTSEESM